MPFSLARRAGFSELQTDRHTGIGTDIPTDGHSLLLKCEDASINGGKNEKKNLEKDEKEEDEEVEQEEEEEEEEEEKEGGGKEEEKEGEEE